jgi:hypothetical protein
VVGIVLGMGALALVADTLAELLLAVSVAYGLSGYALALVAARPSRRGGAAGGPPPPPPAG